MSHSKLESAAELVDDLNLSPDDRVRLIFNLIDDTFKSIRRAGHEVYLHQWEDGNHTVIEIDDNGDYADDDFEPED